MGDNAISSPCIKHIIIFDVPTQIIVLENLEHHVIIYERFVICFNTLNGPLSRLTTHYILANLRPGVLIVLYCKYLKAKCMRQCQCKSISFCYTDIFEYEQFVPF